MIALDTETVNRKGRGEACWIGISGDRTAEIEAPLKFPTIWKFLADNRGPYYCWNLAFDFRAIFHPNVFSKKSRLALERLGIFDETEFPGGMEIQSIPGKLYRIKHLGVEVEFYDLKQFFGLSLDASTKKYLPENAGKKKIPATWYNEMDKALKDHRRAQVLEYARRDVASTAMLGDYFLGQLKAAKIIPKKLISCASLSRELFGARLKKQRPDDRVNHAFEQSFYGGRIETRILGKVSGPLWLADIGSAYPSVMQDLPPLAGGHYISVDARTSGKFDPDFAAYHISVNCPPMLWGPLAVRRDGGIFYPTGRFTTYCGLDGIKLLAENNIPHKIISGVEYYCKNRSKLFDEIPRLYAARKSTNAGHALKIALNSGYGICAERRDEYVLRESGRKYGNFFADKTLIYGSCTNFIYAAKITEKIRCEVWRVLNLFGDRAIFSATDGILISGPRDLPMPGGLGEWGLADNYTGAVVLGSGRYVLYGKNPVHKLRGFGGDIKKHFDRIRLSRKPSVLLPMLSSTSLREWALCCGEGDYNVLRDDRRELTVRDIKREWGPSFSRLDEYFWNALKSTPLIGE